MPPHVPEEILRDFVTALSARFTYKGVGEAAKLSKETVRKFVENISEKPRRTTLDALRRVFWDHYPSGPATYVRERPTRTTLPQFNAILPMGQDAANAVVRKIFELAARFPDELPGEAPALEDLLLRTVRAEYDAMKQYPQQRRRNRRKPK